MDSVTEPVTDVMPIVHLPYKVSVEEAPRLFPWIVWPEPVEGQTHWLIGHCPFSDRGFTVEVEHDSGSD